MIEYNPSIISYEKILQIWQCIIDDDDDESEAARCCSTGQHLPHNHNAAIFTTNQFEHGQALRFVRFQAQLGNSVWCNLNSVRVDMATEFYVAEERHQRYIVKRVKQHQEEKMKLEQKLNRSPTTTKDSPTRRNRRTVRNTFRHRWTNSVCHQVKEVQSSGNTFLKDLAISIFLEDSISSNNTDDIVNEIVVNEGRTTISTTTMKFTPPLPLHQIEEEHQEEKLSTSSCSSYAPPKPLWEQ